MSTTIQNIALIRQRLLQPSSQAPSDLQLLNIFIEKMSDHCLQLQNTQNHWSVGSTDLIVSQGVEDYAINAADFGRPFLVYTVDASDAYHTRREVPFTLLQNQEYRYQGPQQTYQAKHSAVEIAFYRQSPSTPAWYARPIPIPGDGATYKVFYEANYEFGALGDAPGLSPFHHLIRVETALAALDACAWGRIGIEGDAERWQMRVQMLTESLMRDIARYQHTFDSYKAQASRDGVSQKLGMGREYEEQWGYGVGSMANQWGW